MNTFNVKKRHTWSYDEFLKNKLGVVKSEHEIVNKAYSGEEKGKNGYDTLDESTINEKWQDKLQNVYSDFEEFEAFDSTYGLSKRLGFNSAKEAWDANPTVQGSTDPADFKVVGDKEWDNKTNEARGTNKITFSPEVGGVKVTETTFEEFHKEMGKTEGIVLLGAGGNLDEWINGVSEVLNKEGIAKSAKPGDIWEAAYVLKTTGKRNDLALTFKKDSGLDLGKMAMWRLAFGDCSWISDYLVNYKDQHVAENYEMDLDNGEMGYEHAKAVLDRAFEFNKEAGGEAKDWDLQKALDAVCEENGIETTGDDRKDMIIDSIKDILDLLKTQAKNLK